MGLPGNVPDFRLCSRTIDLKPLLSFMYRHMNYRTDHHLYAVLPGCRLGSEPAYQLVAALPPRRARGAASRAA